jgi:hypothetical protein
MKKPTSTTISTSPTSAPFPKPAVLEVTRMRIRGFGDRFRYRDRVAVGEHTYYSLELAGTTHEWMRLIDLWEDEQCGPLEVRLSQQRAIIAEAPLVEDLPPQPSSGGDTPRHRVALSQWRDAVRAAQSRSAAGAAARFEAARRHDELVAELERVRKLAWDSRRRVEERYRELVAAYCSGRYRFRNDRQTDVAIRLPGLGNLPRYSGMELADRPGPGEWPIADSRTTDEEPRP